MKIIKKKNNLENFKNKISEQYYNLQDNNVIEFNNKLKIILNKKNIKYLDPLDYSCDVIKKKCDVLTNKNSKIYLLPGINFRNLNEDLSFFMKVIDLLS